ncbi:MAG: 2-oxo acid dehydrogenase subunit E2 [Chloroflexi bacterium]|nr:2-oxo acid dehydrogenase subunit E2 [Chloroflexota bacterium]
MPANVLMPKMGYDMTEGKISRWLKSEGDQVSRGEPIAEIETDKVTIEIESFVEGRLQKILAQPGQTVPVGQPIAVVEPVTEQAPPEAPPPPTAAVGTGEGEEAVPTQERAGPGGVAQPTARKEVPARAGPRPMPNGRTALEERTKASPIARKLAEQYGLDLSQMEGTGPGGRITREDVEAFRAQHAPARPAAPPPPPPAPAAPPPPPRPPTEVERKPLSRVRQVIARRMAESKQQAPHFYLTVEIDMAEALRLREQLNAELPSEEQVTVNDLVARACARVLPQYPDLNASYVDGEIELHPHVNLGIAVAVDEGLIVPVLAEAEGKTLVQVARETKRLVQGARDGRLSPEAYSGATFTLSNLGMYGVQSFVAIINPPQAAILAVGAAEPRPVVRDNAVVVRPVMQATLSADHRVTDGARAAQFLAALRRLLEHPVALVL